MLLVARRVTTVAPGKTDAAVFAGLPTVLTCFGGNDHLAYSLRRMISWLHRDVGKNSFKIIKRYGLGQVMIEPGFKRQCLVFGLPAPALRNDRGVFEQFVFAKRATDLVSIHSRQSDIEKNHVWPVFSSHRECLSAIVGEAIIMTDSLQHPGHCLSHVGIVVDNQDFERTDGYRFGSGLVSRGRRHRVGGAGHADAEYTSFTDTGAFCFDGPAMHGDELFHEGQADSKSALCAIQVLVELGEKLKHLGLHSSWNADAAVGHLDHGDVALGPHRKINATTRRRILRRIVQKISDDLRQAR